MRIKEIKVFQYEELTEKARERCRNASCYDDFWAKYVTDHAKEIASLMGWHIDKVYWTGFHAQGDGACFEGEMRYANGCVEKVKRYAPRDTELHRIAQAWYELQRKNFYAIRATVKHRGHYYHSFSTSFDVEDMMDAYGYLPENNASDIEKDVQEIARDFMQWIYNCLEKEYEYQNSDKTIEENIILNEYEFDVQGNRV